MCMYVRQCAMYTWRAAMYTWRIDAHTYTYERAVHHSLETFVLRCTDRFADAKASRPEVDVGKLEWYTINDRH